MARGELLKQSRSVPLAVKDQRMTVCETKGYLDPLEIGEYELNSKKNIIMVLPEEGKIMAKDTARTMEDTKEEEEEKIGAKDTARTMVDTKEEEEEKIEAKDAARTMVDTKEEEKIGAKDTAMDTKEEEEKIEAKDTARTMVDTKEEEKVGAKDIAIGFAVGVVAVAGVAVVGLGAWALYKSGIWDLLPDLNSVSKKKKMMKAPGWHGYIVRDEFEHDPAGYFRTLRSKK